MLNKIKSTLKHEHVAVALIYSSNGQVLISKRHAGLHQGNKWEFPGGKVESNETVYQALQRECLEEIGIVVQEAEPFCQVKFEYQDKSVLLDTWRVIAYKQQADFDLTDANSQTFLNREGQELRWVDIAQLEDYPFPEPNRKIIEQLLVISSIDD